MKLPVIEPGLKKVFRARQLLTVLSAQSASTYANQVIALVVPWLVLTRTGNAASAGTIAFVMGIAALLGTLTGGLVTDRIGGRRVSILADSLSLITALALAVTLWFDSFSLWIVAVTQVLGVFFDGPGQIAKSQHGAGGRRRKKSVPDHPGDGADPDPAGGRDVRRADHRRRADRGLRRGEHAAGHDRALLDQHRARVATAEARDHPRAADVTRPGLPRSARSGGLPDQGTVPRQDAAGRPADGRGHRADLGA